MLLLKPLFLATNSKCRQPQHGWCCILAEEQQKHKKCYQSTIIALSVGDADTRTLSRGHHATLMTGLWPDVDNTWAQLVDGRVANDVGSTVHSRIQLWHATASTDADDGLQSTQVTWLTSSRFETQTSGWYCTGHKHCSSFLCMYVLFVCWYMVPPGEILCFEDYFSSSSIIVRYLCAIRVLEVWAWSSFPRLPLCQILFLSRPPRLS